MATSAKPQKGNRYTLFALSLLLFFLFCLFIFSRKALEPNLSLYRDLLSLTPIPILLHNSPSPRSTDFHQKSDSPEQSTYNVDVNTTIVSESEFQENSNGVAKVPISSKADLDDKTAQKTAAPVASSEPESRDSYNEITAAPISSNEKIISPISSKSDLDDKNRGDSKFQDVNKKSSEGAVSPDGEIQGVISNVIVEKLKNCDIYKGTWVKDEGYPLYKPGTCPYVDEGFDCQRNGRPDSGYLNWRWKPDGCDLPRFNIMNFLFIILSNN